MKPIMKKSIISSLFAFFFVTAFLLNLSAQGSQVGSDIDGESAGDRLGNSVSLSADGRRLAIGAPGSVPDSSTAGQVRIFDWSGTSWVQIGSDIEGEAAVDNSGISVSISADGNRLAIGAQYNDGNGADAGHVRVYDWNGTSWVQVGNDIDGETAEDQSGKCVTLSADGSRLAIGAPRNDGNGQNAGHVRVFDWSGSSWVQIGSDIEGETPGDLSGFSISLSADGNRLAIGAYGNNGNGEDAGHARVYEWSGSNWVQIGSDIDGTTAQDYSGFSISLSADGARLALGAINIGPGHVRVYTWNGGGWIPLGNDIEGEAAQDYFGFSVSLSANGSRIAIGATLNDGNGTEAGHVRVYNWNGSSWVQLCSDFDGEAAINAFGTSVSLSSDGSLLAGGAIANNGDGIGGYTGHVRVYNVALPMGTSCDDGLLCTINDMEDGNCNCGGTTVSLVSDINADGITNTSDFLLLIGSFGQMCTCPEDLNDDGIVSTVDFLSLVGQFGLNCLGI